MAALTNYMLHAAIENKQLEFRSQLQEVKEGSV